ncbi:MAG: hypothetical protein QF437_29485, partial [Planctomycetota bacterium]|nr:hypothetical protein [Planctomycetota bacterium]
MHDRVNTPAEFVNLGQVSGIGFWILDSGFWILDSRFKIQDSRFKIQDSRFKIQDSPFHSRFTIH